MSDPLPSPPPCYKRISTKAWIAIVASIVVVITAVILVLVLVVFRRISFFIYVNDIHLDPLYQPLSRSTDGSSCRNTTATSTVPYPFGQYGCDPPETLFRSMLKFWPTVAKSPDFILFGGDCLAHGTKFNRSQLQSVFRLVVDGMSSVYPGIPLLVTLGNNEFASDYGTFSDDPADFASLGEVMRPFLSAGQFSTFLNGGYYYHDLDDKKLRLLLLNTVIYSSRASRNSTLPDPYDQFAWIATSASAAHAKGYGVGIAMHIPPGISYIDLSQGWPDHYVQTFDRVCKDNNILFTLAAHTHYDMLMPVFGATGASKGYSLSSPAVSPVHGNNPAFRLVDYDGSGILNVHQYYTDILMNPQDELSWQKEYDFRDAYAVDDLGTESLRSVVKWVTETGEGTWRYKERVSSRAADNGAFYHCILTATTVEQVQQCMATLQNVRSRASLVPYGGDDGL
jgi:sphingomyelin phosphodiesterase acid-like 3